MPSFKEYMVLHVDLVVKSMAESLRFYSDAMCFSVADDVMLRGPIVHHISDGRYEEVRLVLMRSSSMGAMIELLEFQEESAIGSHSKSVFPQGALSILVPDLEVHMKRASSKGWDPVSDVFAVELPRRGHCRLVFYEDPDRHRIEVIQSSPR